MKIAKSELKEWARQSLVGVQNITMPSFTPDLSELDEDGIRWDVQQAIRHGFFATMCVTESMLTFEECKRFVEIVADEAKGKILVGVNLALDSFERNIALARHAEKAGASLLNMGFPPNFYPADVEEVYRAGKKMIEATSLAVTIHPSPHFNFERFHPSCYPPELIERFADIDNVVATEIGDPGLAADAISRVDGKILVSCPIERFLPMMWGACKQQFIGPGPYEAFQSPEKPFLVDYFRLLREGDHDKAWEIYWHLTPARVFFEQNHMPGARAGTYNWPLMKYYQWLVGGNGGYVRQPTMKVHHWESEPYKFALMQLEIEPREPDEEFYCGRLNFEKIRKGTLKLQRAQDY